MKRVILSPNPYRDENFQTVRSANRILREAGMETRICLPFDVDRNYELPKDIRFFRLEREMPNADLIICFGGDGTILHMAKAATKNNLPILGVNIGTMGFMAELESGELGLLKNLSGGRFQIDRRMMLNVRVTRGKEVLFDDICLNDVVITKGSIARIIYLNVNCDGSRALECGGDGVIVATPTGSTAYSLSAGGPFVEPDARNILVTPICSHDVFSRCIVTSDDRKITVELAKNARRNAFLSVDGGKALRLNIGDIVTITKSNMETRLIKLKNRSFYEVVSAKFRNSQGEK